MPTTSNATKATEEKASFWEHFEGSAKNYKKSLVGQFIVVHDSDDPEKPCAGLDFEHVYDLNKFPANGKFQVVKDDMSSDNRIIAFKNAAGDVASGAAVRFNVAPADLELVPTPQT